MNILVTGVGAIIGYGIINSLRRIEDLDIYILLVWISIMMHMDNLFAINFTLRKEQTQTVILLF